MDKALAYSLSELDLRKIVGEKIPIIEYYQLNDIYDINHILDYGCCIILFELKKDNGHWLFLQRVNKSTLEFFDSYSNTPDAELKWIDVNKRKKLHEDFPKLSELMINSKYKKIVYLKHRLQKWSNKIATCGRHVAVRCLARKIPLKKYEETLRFPKGKLKGLSPDQLVVISTFPIIGH